MPSGVEPCDHPKINFYFFQPNEEKEEEKERVTKMLGGGAVKTTANAAGK